MNGLIKRRAGLADVAMNGEAHFWDAVDCVGFDHWVDALEAFAASLDDPELPSWMQVTALQGRAWCHMHLYRYQDARKSLQELRTALTVSKPKVDYLDLHSSRCPRASLAIKRVCQLEKRPLSRLLERYLFFVALWPMWSRPS